MKKVLMLLMLVLATVACTPEQKDKAAKAVEATTKVVKTATDVASAAGVPYASTLGMLLPFLGTTILALIGRGSQKRKKEALYQSTADLHLEANQLAIGLKNKTISLEEVIRILPSMVKDVSTITHIAYNEYKAIEKDVNKYQKKGKLRKLA